ncbi:disintegrin and metalloproteinase domain-containing protein 10-like [Haemaphysalis longicornis]
MRLGVGPDPGDHCRGAAEFVPFIRNYELLSYPVRVGSSNSSVKRIRRDTADTSGTRHIRFNARGRHFHLVLSLDLSAFSNDFVARAPSGPVEVDLSHAVSGYVYVDPGSHVFGSILGGVFEGRTSTGDGRVFYVEPAWKYPTLSPQSGHSVFYAAGDVRLPPDLQETHGGCGLDRLQKHLAAEEVDLRAHRASLPWPSLQHRGRRIRQSPDIAEYPGVVMQEPLTQHRLFKGRIGAGQDSNRRLCHLQISLDHILYTFYAVGVDDHTARECITSLVNTHITSTNVIYSLVDFNGNVGMRFMLQDLRINDSCSCDSPHVRSNNPFCRTDLDANLLLKFK